MPLTDSEFAAILEDESKRIRDDIAWTADEDHSPALEFRVDVESTHGWPLLLKGRYNPAAGTLTYALRRAASTVSTWARITTTRHASRSATSTNIDGPSVTGTRRRMCRLI